MALIAGLAFALVVAGLYRILAHGRTFAIYTGQPYERGWLCSGQSCRALFQYDQNANPCPYCGERSDPTTVQVLRAGRVWLPWTWGTVRIRKYVRKRGEGF